jgi:hypothetical protein
MATAPEKINAKEFTGIRDEIVDLLESDSATAPYLASAIGMLSSIENRAMTTASPAYKSFGDRAGSLRRGLWGGPSIYDPQLGWFKKQEMPSMGDRRQNFINIVGQPFANALVSMLPQED